MNANQIEVYKALRVLAREFRGEVVKYSVPTGRHGLGLVTRPGENLDRVLNKADEVGLCRPSEIWEVKGQSARLYWDD